MAVKKVIIANNNITMVNIKINLEVVRFSPDRALTQSSSENLIKHYYLLFTKNH